MEQLRINFSQSLSAKLLPEGGTGIFGTTKRTIVVAFPFELAEYLYDLVQNDLCIGKLFGYWHTEDDDNYNEGYIQLRDCISKNLLQSLDIDYKLFALEIPEGHPMFSLSYKYFDFED